MLHLAKLQTAPHIVYTSSRADASFIEHLQQPYETFIDRMNADGMTAVKPQVRLEKAAIFSYEQVEVLLISLSTYLLSKDSFCEALVRLSCDNQLLHLTRLP